MTQSASAAISKNTLAMDGGEPVTREPFAPWPHFPADEVEAAAAVLRSGKVNYWTGEEGRAFEREFASFAGVKHAIALVNGTLALELALFGLNIGPGDEVIVPARTFIATASCAVMRGATPVCADVDRDSGTITAETIRAALSPRTRAVIVVHLAGWPCEMDPILELCRERRIQVVEDCAQCHGATYQGRPAGSMGDVAAFSFCQDKIMTTGGEGGMLLTNDSALWERCWAFKDHGKSYDAVYRREHVPGFRWLHESFGSNWRLTEMQSALGRIQLGKLPESMRLRRAHAAALAECFSRIQALRVPVPPGHAGHAVYKLHVYLRPERLRDGWARQRVIEAINAEGVPCFSGSCSEIYLEKAFPEALRPPHRLPVARELGETSLMFQVHPTLTAENLRATCAAVEKVMQACSR